VAKIGFSSEISLMGGLRQTVETEAELIDLSRLPSGELSEMIHSVDILLGGGVQKELFDKADQLRAIMATGAGYNGIDVDACTARGVLVTNQAGGNAISVAEHAMGLLLSLRKRICEADRAVRRGTLKRGPQALHFLNHEISGGTLGIIGYGAIGRALARMAKHGFGMAILAHDPFVAADPDGLAEMVAVDTLLETADVVSLNVPLTATTSNMITFDELRSMRPTAVIINTSRGGIVDQEALVKALQAGEIAGAGLDVFDDDYLGPGHPLAGMENVVLSPHIGGATYESLGRRAGLQAQAIMQILHGDIPTTANLINREAADRFKARFA
jgi:phosphoglycerate dehydrogenase-like enzyme